MVTTGDSIGPWTVQEKLGSGGNASVWRASHDGGDVVALKVISTTKAQRESYRRFVQEIQFLQSIGDFPGVLPLLDFNLLMLRSSLSSSGSTSSRRAVSSMTAIWAFVCQASGGAVTAQYGQ
jgi:serine/threonine protein kinase